MKKSVMSYRKGVHMTNLQCFLEFSKITYECLADCQAQRVF
jgi:hypothetical protein